MTLEIQILAWDRHKSVIVQYILIGGISSIRNKENIDSCDNFSIDKF